MAHLPSSMAQPRHAAFSYSVSYVFSSYYIIFTFYHRTYSSSPASSAISELSCPGRKVLQNKAMSP
ncbi:hypothetical protein K469DRAFT_705880 [Zopfia rhizophila CBS 207.26]|uniref:Uncharacterized protein n=1 Tax=Zopfia rhizophila CBS 207.26 TaxID=1314779 RepID=A0A6A6ESZ6_9PEZI|nr:hypothetical protein K469DRAFT_705880 [Zopfia rhizophila CBS 207.26]